MYVTNKAHLSLICIVLYFAERSDRAEDRHGADAACDVRPGARASYNALHEGASHGQQDRREELCPSAPLAIYKNGKLLFVG